LALLTLAVLLIFAPTLAIAFTVISTSTGVIRVTDGVVQVTVPPALPQLTRPPPVPEADTKLTPLGSTSVMTTDEAGCNDRLPTESE
jgi:hypothetical protein